jgi:hypothetical protein
MLTADNFAVFLAGFPASVELSSCNARRCFMGVELRPF